MGWEWIPVFGMVVIAAAIDIRRGIIPNWLTLPGFVGGLVWHFSFGGVKGLYFALGGAFFASMLFLVPFLWGGVGGGDFKLILALGSFLGPWDGVRTALAIAIVGGVMSLIALLLRTRGRKGAQEGEKGAGGDEIRRGQKLWPPGKWRDWGTIPYGPAIAMGTAWAIFAA